MNAENMKTLLKILLVTVILNQGLYKAHAAVEEQKGHDSSTNKGFPPDILYKLLVAEFAYYRNNPGLAIDTYTYIAKQTRDANVAEQATRLTIQFIGGEKAIEAARLWLEVDPLNLEPRKKLVPFLIKKGNTEEAIKHLRVIVETSLNSQETEANLSQTESRIFSDDPLSGFDFALNVLSIFIGKDLEEQATRVMQQLVSEYNKDNIKAQIALAKFFARAKRLQKALEIVRSVVLLAPDDEQIVIFYTQLHRKLGDDGQALEVLSEFFQHHPDASLARITYANTLINLGQYDEALKAFEELLRRDPENDDARYSFGLLLLKMGQTAEQVDQAAKQVDQAAEQFEKLVNSKSIHLVNLAYFYLAQIAESRGQIHEAIAFYKKIHNTQDSQEYWLNAQFKIANLLKKSGDLTAAQNHLHGLPARNEAIQANIYGFEAHLLIDAGLEEEAIAVYKRAIKEIPQNTELLFAYSTLAEELGKTDIIQVIEPGLRAILSENPEDAEVLNFLGYALTEHTDRYEEAYDLLKRANQLLPEDPYITDSLGWALFRMGKYEEALGYLHQAMSLLPTPETAAHLGEVLWVLGQQDKARSVWNEALQHMKDRENYEYLIKTVERLTLKLSI